MLSSHLFLELPSWRSPWRFPLNSSALQITRRFQAYPGFILQPLTLFWRLAK
jgi:hypothetical protein